METLTESVWSVPPRAPVEVKGGQSEVSARHKQGSAQRTVTAWAPTGL